MSVTYRTLTGMAPRAFSDSSKDLSGAVTTLATEYRQYKARVVTPVKARRGWSGGGQPDAAVVAEVNGLAIDTMRLRLAAGALAYVYAYVGFTVAQQQLAAVCRKAENDGFTVNADGSVTSTTVPVGDDNGPGSTSAKAQAHQRDIGKVLRFATTIDTGAARALNTSHEQPVTALTNRPGLLEQARADHANAALDAQSISSTLELLPHEAAKYLPSDADLPGVSVSVPPGATATTMIGALLIGAGLAMTAGGAGGGLALAGVSGGTSVVGGGAVAAGGAVVAVVGGVLVVVGGASLTDTRITTTTRSDPPRSLDDLMQQAKKAESQAKPSYQPPKKITSSIKNDPLLTREAKRAGKNQGVQQDLDRLTKKLGAGNMNPGTDTRSLPGTDVYYARAKGGARLFFRNTDDGIEIVGKSSKNNENVVIDRLEVLYGR